MRIARAAELFALKYKIAADPADIEASVRNKIATLWIVPNKTHNILRACADSGISKPVTMHEKKAMVGYQFCRQLLNLIDYLKINKGTISLGEMREVLLTIIKLVSENKDIKFGADGKISKDDLPSLIQFPHVSELIFQIFPINKKNDIKQRNELFNKARTGLSRILSISIDTIKDLQTLEIMAPEKFTYKKITNVDIDKELPNRFIPQRAMLSENDIIDFIRQYGDQYGISSQEDWGIAFRDDHQLKQEITTVINALNRGHYPKDAATAKMEIAEILKNHEERKSSNSHLFEDSE